MTTAPRLVPAPARPPGTLTALRTLLAKEARLSLPLLLIVIGGMLLFDLLVLWRGPSIAEFFGAEAPSRVAASGILIAVPVLWLLRAGFQLRSEYALNTQSLLTALPIGGSFVMVAKYLWVMAEVLLLTLLVNINSMFFAALDFGWEMFGTISLGGVQHPLNVVTLTHVWNVSLEEWTVSATVPAVTLLAVTVSRQLRVAEPFVTFVVFGLVTWLYVWLYIGLDAANLGTPGLSARLLGADGHAFYGLEFILLSFVVIVPTLWLAGRLFERSDG